jgi:dipeptidyl aminopeptidase/acylaminoacyl peptidase
LDSVAAQPLAGTDGASYPFWSPDSRSIGFFADNKLKRIDVAGGAPQVIANSSFGGRGGSWNREGTIIFASSGPLFKVSATGGDPVAITPLETVQLSIRFPQFLPDGRHFIYFVPGGNPKGGVYAGSLDGTAPKRLATADARAVVSPSGFLLFVRQTTLFAQSFDLERQELSGNPFSVTEQVAYDKLTSASGFSATLGTVAYRAGSVNAVRQLTWVDRSGKTVRTVGAPDTTDMTDVALSPDEKRVAVTRSVNGNMDVWLIDTIRGVPTRFTFDATNLRPAWSHDGSRVVFGSNRKGPFNLFWKLSSGAGADELLLESNQNKGPADLSPDGRFLMFFELDAQTGIDLSVLPLFGDKKPFAFVKTLFEERVAEFSPDGKWIAYQSNDSGRFQIYVQPFPGPGGKFQISSNGGVQPRWNKNGKEIFYVSLDSNMMAASVKLSPGGALETATPAALFPVRIAGGPLGPAVNSNQQYAVSSDGERFLVNLAADEGTTSPITLIYNWKPPKP